MYNIVYNTNKVDILQTDEFERWLKKLKDPDARARVNARIRRISLTGNFGDAKPIGEGIEELRIDYGPGYRIYYARREGGTMLLLLGGSKATQRPDVAKAKSINADYE